MSVDFARGFSAVFWIFFCRIFICVSAIISRSKAKGVDENLKARDQMAWVQAVNVLTAQAEEAVLQEIVYR
mgnify:CR=1 FL=1